jgi:predicted nucleotidyltransferase
VGKSWRIKCNKKHIFNKTKKVAFNMQMVYSSDIIPNINKLFPNFQAIILFGSFRKGDDIENSDIDIAINILGKNELKIEELGIINKFGYRKKMKINLHIFSKDKIDKNLFSNIANGIVLEGFLEI